MRFASSFPSSGGISRKNILSFAFGITFGFSVAHMMMDISTWKRKTDTFWSSMSHFDAFADIFEEDKLPIDPYLTAPPLHKTTEEFHQEKTADQLFKEVRVLCWVMTAPANHARKAKAVKATWGKRCNVLLFMSSQEDRDLPTIALDVKEGRDHLWAKTKKAFTYVHDHYLDAADWFMKADDDTYVVVENLRYMLQSHSPEDPVYFGRRFMKYVDQGYMSGGAGYVLSREAVKRFVRVALLDVDTCWDASAGAEDVEIGKCLQNAGVLAGDSRDESGKGRFFPFSPEQHLFPGYLGGSNWYWDYTNTSYSEKGDCCSDTAISFHYTSPEMMHLFDYLIYHLHPHGTSSQLQSTSAIAVANQLQQLLVTLP